MKYTLVTSPTFISPMAAFMAAYLTFVELFCQPAGKLSTFIVTTYTVFGVPVIGAPPFLADHWVGDFFHCKSFLMKKVYSVLSAFLFLSISTAFSQSTIDECDCAYPIIFVHGWAGSEYSWENFANELESVWGDEFKIPEAPDTGESGTVYYANLNFRQDYTNLFGEDGEPDNPFLHYDDDVVLHDQFVNSPELLGNRCLYAISFNTSTVADGNAIWLSIYDKGDKVNSIPGESDSNESSAFKQGYALGQMIKRVLDKNQGKDKVILVGHSMGGLAIREYLQRKKDGKSIWWAYPDEVETGHRVARVLTVGTPHRGSNTGNRNVSWADDVLKLFNQGDFNLRSEAVRDLRYSYEVGNDPSPGVYLFGGNENEILTDNLESYYNLDVNCDGNEDDAVSGINISGDDQFAGLPGITPWIGTFQNLNFGLPTDVKFTYYVSDITQPFPFGQGLNHSDGIVLADRQWLFNGGNGSSDHFDAGVSIAFPYFQSPNFW